MQDGLQFDSDDFRTIYAALTGKNPYMWQVRIGDTIRRGAVPRNVVVPTGGGKTGIIAAWLTAWCMEAIHGDEDITKCRIGRRMAWVVNRRTVVDDVGAEAVRMAKRIQHGAYVDGLPWGERLADAGPGDESLLAKIASRLHVLGGGRHPLAVSSLRGELVDAGEWRIDPARLGIIIGTPMMIGSKLLFRGVDDGRSRRSQSAGILGCDSIIVHDECHLEPAFDSMLDELRHMASSHMDGLPNVFRPCALSATPPAGGGSDVFMLNRDESAEERIRKVVETRKMMKIVELSTTSIMDNVVKEAIALGTCRQQRVLVFIRNPNEAKKVADEIAKKAGGSSVGLLTGTMRGHEREELTGGSLFANFRTNPNRPPVDKSVYLVATSAGEVGVDIDGDAAVMDGCTLDSLGQRLGRVGRSGNRPGEDHISIVSVWKKTAEVDVVSACTDKTLKMMLSRADGDTGLVSVGPAEMTSLFMSSDASAATMPKAKWRQIGVNNWPDWRNTSVQPSEGIITLDQHIMGESDWEPAVTEVSWREEIPLLCGCSETELGDMIERFPIRAAERLTANSSDVRSWLQERVNSGARGCFISIYNGKVRLVDLSDLMNGRSMSGRAKKFINDCQIIVPTSWYGLSENGMLDGEVGEKSPHPILDVAEIGVLDRRQRIVVTADPDGDESTSALLGGDVHRGLRTGCSLQTRGVGRIEYRIEPSMQAAPVRVELNAHLDAVGRMCRSIGSRMGLHGDIGGILQTAGEVHDLGKEDIVWQKYAGNVDPSGKVNIPLAKSASYSSPSVLGGLRHEAVSVRHPKFFKALASINSDEMRNLLTHIVTAHHGWGRPVFTPDSGHEDVPGQMINFRTLECSVGIYQLALLEAVLKCADTIVSVEESK